MIKVNSTASHLFYIVIVGFLISGCSSDGKEKKQLRKDNLKGEYIYRQHDDSLFSFSTPKVNTPEAYPWEQQLVGNHSCITKEFFRCKGSMLNPAKVVQKKEELVRYFDCGGAEKHSLPLKDGKEFVYPVLIDLLNYIQLKTGKRVVITCGHRCPDHHAYVDPASFNKAVKHLIGAQVSFYVQGMEERPESVIALMMAYYKNNPKYQGDVAYEEFKKEQSESDVSTQPWLNKEIFIKLYRSTEGRDFDQRHPYPYISVQVRFDRDANEKVIYSWDRARQYHRW